jgi:paraquat-inducible protein B
MSEKPHTVAIGAFIVGALLIAVSTFIFVLGSGFGSDRNKVVMVFNGSVKGLTIGAPVALRGVQIGQVTGIELIMDSDTVELIMLVEAEIRGDNIRRSGSRTEDLTDELISRGLRAQLNSQSMLTGLLYIQLDFHRDSKINLADIDSPYLQIPTIPTELERITRQIESLDLGQLASNLQDTAAGLSAFVSSEKFQELPATLDTTLQAVTDLGKQLNDTIARAGPQLDSLLENTNTTVGTVNGEIPRLSQAARQSLASLDKAIATFEVTMAEMKFLVDADSPTTYQLNQALRELSQAGKALQSLASSLEEQPESLIRGRREK